MTDTNICREYTSVDASKSNGRVEQKLTLVIEGGMAAFLGFRFMLNSLDVLATALTYGRT